MHMYIENVEIGRDGNDRYLLFIHGTQSINESRDKGKNTDEKWNELPAVGYVGVGECDVIVLQVHFCEHYRKRSKAELHDPKKLGQCKTILAHLVLQFFTPAAEPIPHQEYCNAKQCD